CLAHLAKVVEILKPSYLIGVGAFAEERLKRAAETADSGARIGKVLHPSPASPAANRGWAEAATRQLETLGVWCLEEFVAARRPAPRPPSFPRDRRRRRDCSEAARG